jgi:hypothetical protein
MLYKVNITYDEESDHWNAIGENANVFMCARSVDLLIDRTNLALSDLLGINQFEIEYILNHRMEVNYG